MIDPASMIGAIRAKIHSNLWSIVPATAYSGLEKSHSRYEPPIDASAIRTSVVAAAIAMQGACSTRCLDSRARANWSFSTSSFSESACRPPGSDVGTVSPGSVLTGVSSTSPMATSISASGTESPRSHLDTVCLTTFSLSASSSCERPFYFLRAWIFSFSMGGSFLSPGSYVTAMLPADGPLLQATGCNVREDCLISQGGYKLVKTLIEKGAAMSVFDWGSGFVLVATQLLPGVVAVVLALAAAVAARSKAMPVLIGASGLAAALSLLGVLMQLQHFAHVDNASAWYDTIDVYVACAVALIVLTFGLNLVALVRGFRNQG